MHYEFEYKGGVEQIGTESCCKFMLFHLIFAKEIPFWEAKKNNIATRPSVAGMTSNPKNLYSIESPIFKVFLYDLDFGRQKISYSFFLNATPTETPQTVTIKPVSKAGVKAGFYFKCNARFLKKSEALNLMAPDSQSYKMLLAQSALPIDTLKSIVTITRPKVIEQARKVRKLRIG